MTQYPRKTNETKLRGGARFSDWLLWCYCIEWRLETARRISCHLSRSWTFWAIIIQAYLLNFLSHEAIYTSTLHLKLFVIYSTHKARTCVDILECPKMHLIGLCIYYVGLVNQARIVCVGFTVQRAQLHVFLSCFRSRWSFTSSVTPNAWADSELLTRWVCKH